MFSHQRKVLKLTCCLLCPVPARFGCCIGNAFAYVQRALTRNSTMKKMHQGDYIFATRSETPFAGNARWVEDGIFLVNLLSFAGSNERGFGRCIRQIRSTTSTTDTAQSLARRTWLGLGKIWVTQIRIHFSLETALHHLLRGKFGFASCTGTNLVLRIYSPLQQQQCRL